MPGDRCQRADRLAIPAMQPNLVATVLRKGDSLSVAAFQSVSNIVGEATTIRPRVRCAYGDRHDGRPTPGPVFTGIEAIG